MHVILIDQFYGYCPGLKRSLKMANDLIEKAAKEGKAVVCDVPLAHNKNVFKSLEERGVKLIPLNDKSRGENKYFLVSAHGASMSKIADLKRRGFQVEDTVCSTVWRVQNQARNDYANDCQIVIFGKADHPEVIGINGCVNNSAIVSRDPGATINLDRKTCVLSQTTMSPEKFRLFVSNLKTQNPHTEIIVRKTICPLVNNRIKAIIKYVLENRVTTAVVVGSATSSNTRQLAERLSEVIKVYFVECAADLVISDYNKAEKIIVVSGTSAPPEVVEEVAEKLQQKNI